MPCSGVAKKISLWPRKVRCKKSLENREFRNDFRRGFLARQRKVVKPTQRAGLYARVSTHDQQTIKLQLEEMRQYVERRGWEIAFEMSDIRSGAKERAKRDALLKAARKREVDVIVVWKLDRWGRSLADLVTSLSELNELSVGFVSLTEALDLTTPSGRAMAGLLAVFAEFERDLLRERVRVGIAQARKEGKPHGRPATVAKQKSTVRKLFAEGKSKSEIARRLNIGRTSVRRMLNE